MIKALINKNEIRENEKYYFLKITFSELVKKCSLKKILVENKNTHFKKLKDKYSIEIKVKKVINLLKTNLEKIRVEALVGDVRLPISIYKLEPRIYTTAEIKDDKLYLKLSLYNATFDENVLDSKNIKISCDEIKNLSKKLTSINVLNNNEYIFCFDLKNKKIMKLNINIVFNTLKIQTDSEVLEYKNKVFSFNYKKECPLLLADGIETIYDKVIKDKFPWKSAVRTGLTILGMGVAPIGNYHDKSYGSCCSNTIGLVIGIFKELLNIGETDPLDSIREQLNTISGKLNELSRQLAELTNYLKQISDQTYKGVNKIVYLSYAQNWDKFNSMLEEAISFENNIVSQLKDYFYQWIRGQKGNRFTFYFADAYDEKGNKTSDFGFVNPKYDSDYCTDNVKIQRHLTLEYNIKEIFKDTIKACENGYSSDFMKLFLADIKNCDLDKDIKVIDNGDLYKDYLKSTNGNKEVIALNTLTSLSTIALKSIFTNDQRGKEKAIELNNLVITLLKAFSGISTAGGISPKFSDYYNMLYNKYSFQSEAEEHIKNFRLTMKDIMYHFCGLAKTAAELYPGLDLLPKLKEVYEASDDAFIKNDGLVKIPDDIKNRKEVFDVDYCYITNRFVSMGLMTSIIFGDIDDDSVGAKVYTQVLVKKDSTLAYDGSIDLKKVNIINETTLGQILDRKQLNYTNLSNEDYFKKFNVLNGAIHYNLHCRSKDVYIITSYDGLDRIDLSNYSINPKAECYWKRDGTDYFVLNNFYYLQNYVHGKKWYKAYRTKANVYDLNLNTKVAENLGHVFWHEQRHWQWSHDEIWCFREVKNYRYFYYLFNI